MSVSGFDVAVQTGAAISVAVWLLLTAAVLLVRIVRGAREGRLSALQRRLRAIDGAQLEPEAREAEIDRLLQRLPRIAIDHILVSASESPLLADALARHALRRSGAGRLLVDARRSRGPKWRRIAAMRVLARARHPELVDVLRDASRDHDPDVVEAAVGLLGTLPDHRAAEALVEMLRCGRHAASRVASVLDVFPLPIPDLLCVLTGDRTPAMRYWGATLLGRYDPSPDIEAALCDLASDPDATVRKAAVEALGRMASEATASVATALLADPVFYVRAHAVRALVSLGTLNATETIARALGDPDWWVRRAAAESLTALEPREVVAVAGT
jgi:HEAT repeat protein